MIVHLEGVKEVLHHGYEHSDMQPKNVMIKFASPSECAAEKDSHKRYRIDKNCIVWDKKHFFVVDPAYMRHISKKDLCTSGDLLQAVEPWTIFKQHARSWLPHMKVKTKGLIKQVDRILAQYRPENLYTLQDRLPTIYGLPIALAHRNCVILLKSLKTVQADYSRI